MHNLASLVFHFHFFLRVTGRQEGIDLGQNVECDLVRIDFAGDHFVGDDLRDLTSEFIDRFRTRARNSLVTRSKNARNAERLVQRIKGHERDGGGAIRIRDNALVQLYVRGVNFRHDERNIRVLPERAGIIDDHAANLRGDGREFLRDAAAGAEERDVDSLECIFSEFLHRELRAFVGHGFARGTSGGQQGEFADRKFPLLERFNHFHADGASGTDNGNMRSPVHKKGVEYRARSANDKRH
jgi:hypothetical protein